LGHLWLPWVISPDQPDIWMPMQQAATQELLAHISGPADQAGSPPGNPCKCSTVRLWMLGCHLWAPQQTVCFLPQAAAASTLSQHVCCSMRPHQRQAPVEQAASLQHSGHHLTPMAQLHWGACERATHPSAMACSGVLAAMQSWRDTSHCSKNPHHGLTGVIGVGTVLWS